MSLPTLALVKSYYAAFNRGDTEAMLALLTEDVAHDINQGTREIGIAKFRAFMARMNGAYRERLEDIVVMATSDGSRAAAEFTVHGEYLAAEAGLPPAHGQRYVLPAGAFFAVRQERIARVTNYYNLEDWLRQVRDAATIA
ncbi:MAG TPA: ketosteroid isomerase-related protein [Acetobacteraceae bacterium]|nr:ketosteroid isomerase-related protein [Acetobacteraceae bacterium]